MRFLSASAMLALVSTAAAAPPSDSPPLTYGAPISLDAAMQVVSIAEAEAKSRHVAVTITIVDSGGNLVLEHHMDGATLASIDTTPAKAKSAVLWKQPSSFWANGVAHSPAALSFPHVVAVVGGELIIKDNRIIGGIGVGGSGPNEGEIAKIAASALK